MKRIILEAVPQSAMRPPYNQQAEGGDWFVSPEGELTIRVISDAIDRPAAFLFALHELVEAMLCAKDGVSQQAVDAFDAAFTGTGEAGDDPNAPYRTQHRRAMLVEHLMAHFLGITDYGKVE